MSGTSSVTSGSGISSLAQTAFGELSVAQNIGKIYGQFPYNINSELFNDLSSGTGSLTAASGLCVISSGAAAAGSGKIQSKNVLEYHPGTGGLCRFTAVFDTAVASNVQLAGIGNDDNGFFIGYNGTTFSILRRNGGTDNFTAQANFSEDPLDGTGPSGMTLDPTKGNVYQIQYQWLGFGEIRFSIENPGTGNIFMFHRIKYANANTGVSVLNPTFPFHAESTNDANATDVVLKIPSMSAYSEGLSSSVSHLVHAASATKTSVTTEVAILSIRNNATYAGVTNFVVVQPQIISAAAEGAKPATITLYKNTTLGGTPSFTEFSATTSTVSVDTAGTTITNGIKISAFNIAKSSSSILYLTDLPILLAPGDIFTISGSSANSTDISASITWEERFI